MDRVCVFCGAANGTRPDYGEAARAIGAGLAARGLTLVYGAGSVGLMGATADGALKAGGHVIGVIPQALMGKELDHNGLTRLHVVRTMHERKAMMADLADAFVALPGGFGTLDELCEIITWAQLGFHTKPIALLNLDGYFDGLLAFVDHAVNEGFIVAPARDMLIVEHDVETLLNRLKDHQPRLVDRWLEREDL